MPTSNKMTLEEYQNEVNKVHCSRQINSILSDHAALKVRKQAVSTISKLRRSSKDVLHTGPFRIEVEIHGKCRGDIDNVLKGILDALNGVAYQDDRQCVEARVKLCQGEGDI